MTKKLVHGVYCSNLAEELQSEINYAKTSICPIRALYQVHGMIKMARQLGALTREEYFELDHSCIAEGINNPEIIRRDR